MPPQLAIVLKGYPRLSETFVAQEIRALELRGFELCIFSLRHPYDPASHPIHAEIEAPVNPDRAWQILANRLQKIVDQEFKDQADGFEEFDGFLRGCTIRLPGSMIVTGIDLKKGYNEDDTGSDRPYLTLLQGGRVDC